MSVCLSHNFALFLSPYFTTDIHQSYRGHSKFLSPPLRESICPIRFIFGTNMRGWCVAHHPQIKRSKVMVTRSFEVHSGSIFAVAAVWFCAHSTDSLHISDTKATHEGTLGCKVKFTRVVRNVCLVRSVAPCLFDRFTPYVANNP